MPIAREFQRSCEEFPQNAANLKECRVTMVEEMCAASTEFHMVGDDKTLFAFAFKDGSAMTAVNCEGLRFALLDTKELKAIRKSRHLTKKDLQELELALEAELVGPGPDGGPDREARSASGHAADEQEPEKI
jgi:hypothetical protein